MNEWMIEWMNEKEINRTDRRKYHIYVTVGSRMWILKNRWSCFHFLDVPDQFSWYRCDKEKKRTSDSGIFSIKFIFLYPTDPIFSLNLWTNHSKSRTLLVCNFRYDVVVNFNNAMVKDEFFRRIRVLTIFVD